MDDWQKQWWEMLEKTASDVEKLIEDVSAAVESFTDEFEETIEDFTEQLQESFFAEIDRCVEDIFDLIIDADIETELVILDEINYTDQLDYLSEELDFMGIRREQPTLEKNSACVGCQHYHGRVYGKNLLVCGMHPYGWTDDNCPDWEDNTPWLTDKNYYETA